MDPMDPMDPTGLMDLVDLVDLMERNPMNTTPTPTPTSAAAPGAWEELVTTALLGTERRTPPAGAPGREAPLALLDAAAEETVRRRAGLRPARAAARPEPAAED